MQSKGHLQLVLTSMHNLTGPQMGFISTGYRFSVTPDLCDEEDQQYGRVIAMLGNRRINIDCLDGVKQISLLDNAIQRAECLRHCTRRATMPSVVQGEVTPCKQCEDWGPCKSLKLGIKKLLVRKKGFGDGDGSVFWYG